MIYCNRLNANLLSIPARLFFSDLSYLVIDEADSMFDGNFKRDTMDLLQSISVRRTALLARKKYWMILISHKKFHRPKITH